MRPILIVDFEATCWGPDTLPPSVPAGRAYASEIIEFGCALMTRPDRVERTWQTHVRPTDNQCCLNRASWRSSRPYFAPTATARRRICSICIIGAQHKDIPRLIWRGFTKLYLRPIRNKCHITLLKAAPVQKCPVRRVEILDKCAPGLYFVPQ